MSAYRRIPRPTLHRHPDLLPAVLDLPRDYLEHTIEPNWLQTLHTPEYGLDHVDPDDHADQDGYFDQVGYVDQDHDHARTRTRARSRAHVHAHACMSHRLFPPIAVGRVGSTCPNTAHRRRSAVS